MVVLLMLAGYDFGFQPHRLVASFRAMQCCRENCHKSRPLSAAERCCGVAQDHAGLRAVHANAPDLRAGAIAVTPDQIDIAPMIIAEADIVSASEPSRPPPIFLANQALLL